MSTAHLQTGGVSILAPVPSGCEDVLTPEAVRFLVELHRKFDARRKELLERRVVRQSAKSTAGNFPIFSRRPSTSARATGPSRPFPPDLMDRRVEITGPVDRKMIINALNSGASVFMADFEDSNSPTWRTISTARSTCATPSAATSTSPARRAKSTSSTPKPAILLVRPRGWHLVEKHFLVDGEPMSGSLFDFGLFFFHNAKDAAGKRHRAVLLSAQDGEPSGSPPVERRVRLRAGHLGIPQGTIRATVLIETILGGVRDGRDSLRTAGPLGGPQLRPLGLHFQLHQEVPQSSSIHAARPRRRSPWTGIF